MRQQAGLTVSRFCELAGIPRPTWYRRARRATGGLPARGPWPAPVRDQIEQPAAQLALEWPAWGHPKIHALLAVDGFRASQATVRRALGRRGLLQPVGYQRERRELAKARKAAFVSPPTRRNRVWQTDFSELETGGGGTWQMSGVVDYVAKLALCCPVTTTKTWREAAGALDDARGIVHDLLGVPLLEDCTSPETGELTPVIVVSDNGPCYRAVGFARYIASRPELTHVRTRHRSPGNQRRDRALLTRRSSTSTSTATRSTTGRRSPSTSCSSRGWVAREQAVDQDLVAEVDEAGEHRCPFVGAHRPRGRRSSDL